MQPLNVLFHFAAGPDLTTRLAALSSGVLRVTPCAEPDAALLADTHVLWHVLIPATAAMISAAPRLRLIQKIGVGVNTIDLDKARARGIPVCNLPGTNARAVAELTLALMLAALRRLPMFDAAMRGGRGFALDPALQDGLGELGGRTVGLVGYGAVPRVLAPVLVALGCRVIYTARTSPWRCGRRIPAVARVAGAGGCHQPARAADAGHGADDRCRGAGLHATWRGAGEHGARRAGRSAGAGGGIRAPADWRRRGWTCSPTSRRVPMIRC